MALQYHVCLSVRGYPLGPDKDLAKLYRHEGRDGRWFTPREARERLLEELAQGREVLPFGACDGFDYSGGGCPGHSEVVP